MTHTDTQIEKRHCSFTIYDDKKSKLVYIEDNETIPGFQHNNKDKCVLLVAVIVHDKKVKVRVEKGETMKDNCLCSWKYLLEVMHRVGRATKLAFY